MEQTNIYTKNGYANRETYLHSLATEHNVSYATVLDLADLLGHNEDFDGLVQELEDFSQFI